MTDPLGTEIGKNFTLKDYVEYSQSNRLGKWWMRIKMNYIEGKGPLKSSADFKSLMGQLTWEKLSKIHTTANDKLNAISWQVDDRSKKDTQSLLKSAIKLTKDEINNRVKEGIETFKFLYNFKDVTDIKNNKNLERLFTLYERDIVKSNTLKKVMSAQMDQKVGFVNYLANRLTEGTLKDYDLRLLEEAAPQDSKDKINKMQKISMALDTAREAQYIDKLPNIEIHKDYKEFSNIMNSAVKYLKHNNKIAAKFLKQFSELKTADDSDLNNAELKKNLFIQYYILKKENKLISFDIDIAKIEYEQYISQEAYSIRLDLDNMTIEEIRNDNHYKDDFNIFIIDVKNKTINSNKDHMHYPINIRENEKYNYIVGIFNNVNKFNFTDKDTITYIKGLFAEYLTIKELFKDDDVEKVIGDMSLEKIKKSEKFRDDYEEFKNYFKSSSDNGTLSRFLDEIYAPQRYDSSLDEQILFKKSFGKYLKMKYQDKLNVDRIKIIALYSITDLSKDKDFQKLFNDIFKNSPLIDEVINKSQNKQNYRISIDKLKEYTNDSGDKFVLDISKLEKDPEALRSIKYLFIDYIDLKKSKESKAKG